MSYKPQGDPRTAGPGEIQYLGDSSHQHEGGHRIAIAGREVLVLPDGRSTARNRSHVITRVLHEAAAGGTDSETVISTLVGALVLSGATNITVDGAPVLPSTEEVIAALRLEIIDGEAGPTVRVSSIGGEG